MSEKKNYCRQPHTTKIYQPLTDWERNALMVMCVVCGNTVRRVMASKKEREERDKQVQLMVKTMDGLFNNL